MICDKVSHSEFVGGVFWILVKLLTLLVMMSFSFNYVNFALIENYLFNRKQYVDFISSKSSMKNVTIGIPQGLVLGNLIMNNELSI